MADKPILFSGLMVRALLAGTKTQTRRIVPKQPTLGLDGFWSHHDYEAGIFDADEKRMGEWLADFQRIQTGDRLWVRETWQGLSFGDYLPTKSSQCDVRYAATDPCADLTPDVRGYPWRPSIFMPRWASRLTLTVTDVRVERLHAISEEDAKAEGIVWTDFGTWQPPGEVNVGPNDWRPLAPRQHNGWNWGEAKNGDQSHATAYGAYAGLWSHINGPDAWQANPWVAAYTFTVHRGNIDG